MGIRAVSPSVWALTQPANTHPNTSRRPVGILVITSVHTPTHKHSTRRRLSPFRLSRRPNVSGRHEPFDATILVKTPNELLVPGSKSVNSLICNLRGDPARRMIWAQWCTTLISAIRKREKCPTFSISWCIMVSDAEHAPLPYFSGKFWAMCNVIVISLRHLNETRRTSYVAVIRGLTKSCEQASW